MLSDQVRQLLTAYVDGELTNRQRKAVARLLRRSPEARALLVKLQEDASRLRGLPRRRLGEDFTARVLRLARLRLAEARQRRAAREAALPLWTSFAAAAAVLLAVGAGSFFYFARPPHDSAPGAVSRNNEQQPDILPDSTLGPDKKKDDTGQPDPIKAVADGGTKAPEELPMPVAVADPPQGPVKPVDPVASEALRPDMEAFGPVQVKPLFSLLQDLHGLRPDKFRKDVEKEPALRIELPCRDTSKGFRRLQAALLKEIGMALAIDAAAQNRLDKPRLKTNYVLLVEDVTAEELAKVLAKLGADDKKAAELKPKPDGQFSKLVANRLSDVDRKELAEVLRMGPRQLQPGAGKAGAKGPERLALAVTFNPERPKANSAEVKRYFDARKPARPGSVQALLVLRETPG